MGTDREGACSSPPMVPGGCPQAEFPDLIFGSGAMREEGGLLGQKITEDTAEGRAKPVPELCK